MGKGKTSNSQGIFDDPMIKDGWELGHDGHVQLPCFIARGQP